MISLIKYVFCSKIHFFMDVCCSCQSTHSLIENIDSTFIYNLFAIAGGVKIGKNNNKRKQLQRYLYILKNHTIVIKFLQVLHILN